MTINMSNNRLEKNIQHLSDSKSQDNPVVFWKFDLKGIFCCSDFSIVPILVKIHLNLEQDKELAFREDKK